MPLPRRRESARAETAIMLVFRGAPI